MPRRLLLVLLGSLLVATGLLADRAPVAAAVPLRAGPDGVPAGVLPVPGPLLHPFSPPPEPWRPGHRGVDLAATAGAPVLAAAAGTITYAGDLAGRGVVVVDHGATRTTYEPVQAAVRVGQAVATGEVIGTLQAGHSGCAPATCLHWGLRRGEEYLDPLSLPVVPGGPSVRLVGGDEVAAARRDAMERAIATAQTAAGAVGGAGPPAPVATAVGGWLAPVAGPVTSPFGMRLHPVTGVRKLHDGVDYGAACGTPIRAPLAGTVTDVVLHPAYGWRLRIDHGTVGGHHLVTSLNHARGYGVGVGATVQRGQVVGSVGSTGLSTGCHLHLMAWQDGGLIDPSRLG